MWKRFLTIGICIIFILSLGMTFTMTQGQFKAEPSCSVYAAEVDSSNAEDVNINTVARRSICIGICLYLPNRWGGWGWGCWGKLV